MSHRRSVGVVRALAIVAATLVVAGGTVGAQPAPPATIKIGVILPLSGASAGTGQEMLRGIRLAFSELGNTVAGHKV